MINLQTIRNRTKLHTTTVSAENEQLRISELNNCISVLKTFFADKPGVNVLLFGSITQEFQFTPDSDIDIAVENFTGSRLDLYLDLEKLFRRKIDLIILEKIPFRNEIIETGIKIQ